MLKSKQNRLLWIAGVLGLAAAASVWQRRTTHQQHLGAYADPIITTTSRFATINGIRVHYQVVGQGEPTLVLLHGSFLSIYSWREIIAPLSRLGTVVMFDRPTFGLTERPQTFDRQTDNPYTAETQADLTLALCDHLHIERPVLVGSSAGGTLALLAALRQPGRVRALVLIGEMAYTAYAVSEFPPWLKPLLNAMDGVGPLLAGFGIGMAADNAIRSFWHDRSKVTPTILATYRAALQQPGWERAVWELILATHALGVAERVAEIRIPTLVVTGANDNTVPTGQHIRLARELPNAELAVIPDCGHLPHEECPAAFMQVVGDFIARLPVEHTV